jgi:hypothetical protein
MAVLARGDRIANAVQPGTAMTAQGNEGPSWHMPGRRFSRCRVPNKRELFQLIVKVVVAMVHVAFGNRL